MGYSRDDKKRIEACIIYSMANLIFNNGDTYLNKLDIWGIKIHMLHILKDTALENLYYKDKFHVLDKKEYVDIVCDQLELLREEIVINRLTGDPSIDELVEPFWLTKKFCVLNDIDKELVKRNSYQGIKKED